MKSALKYPLFLILLLSVSLSFCRCSLGYLQNKYPIVKGVDRSDFFTTGHGNDEKKFGQKQLDLNSIVFRLTGK